MQTFCGECGGNTHGSAPDYSTIYNDDGSPREGVEPGSMPETRKVQVGLFSDTDIEIQGNGPRFTLRPLTVDDFPVQDDVVADGVEVDGFDMVSCSSLSRPTRTSGKQRTEFRFGREAPLVVVLHGCTQDAAVYDHGSGWSTLADRHGRRLVFAGGRGGAGSQRPRRASPAGGRAGPRPRRQRVEATRQDRGSRPDRADQVGPGPHEDQDRPAELLHQLRRRASQRAPRRPRRWRPIGR